MNNQPKESRKNIRDAVSYRIPAQIRVICAFSSSFGGYSTYPVCPRCKITMEREFQAYCDRCGQALAWDAFEDALVVYY